ncbi:cNMP-binding protein [Legionella beliardensis]|uniref:cNMP-binding protein n=1 Tax=Legionella beliardensis TaxID=91822 RepID=A0A378HYH4_9GAMM|nr:cyclic nucleotide-binding domain-containing protein [Legionella beliardensis]STX27948.1 cNMP-binding protein [Legionella beliardensis]
MNELTLKECSLLKNSPLFQSLTEDDFKEIIKISHVLNFNKGQILLTEGEYSDDIYIIILGEVNLYKMSGEEKKRHFIITLSSGESLGERRLIKDHPCSSTVETNTPVKLLRLSIQILNSPPFQYLLNLLHLSLAKMISTKLTSDNQINMIMNELTLKERSLLKNSLLFQSLTEDEFKEIIKVSQVLNFNKGQILLTEGEYSDDIYIIILGEVNLYKMSREGKKRRLITTLSSGESLGEMRLIKEQPCSLTVEANTPVKLLHLSIRLLRSQPFQHSLNSLIRSLAIILSTRLTSDNLLLCNKIDEGNKKTTQLWVLLITIFILILFLLSRN